MQRLRRGWRLTDLEARTGLSAVSLGRQERGRVTSLERLRRHAAALDLRLELQAIGRSAEVPRLRDDEHAAIVNALAHAFADAGWRIEAEASYSIWGERGRIDLLAQSPNQRERILAVVEVKADLGDLQQLLGSANVRERLAPKVADQLGWPRPDRTVTVLAIASTPRNRVLVAAHSALFGPFSRRWYRVAIPHLGRASRMLLWVPASATGRDRWLAGRQRVRVTAEGSRAIARTGADGRLAVLAPSRSR